MQVPTHISIILDRSGSMSTCRSDMEGGLQSFMKEQAAAENVGDCTVSLYQFDDEYEVVFEGRPIAEVTDIELSPRGRTALYDAVGRTLTRINKQRIEAARTSDTIMPNEIVMIITDGYENASIEWTLDAVKKIIQTRQNAGWTITYLGANQDSWAIAHQGMGITGQSVMDWSQDSAKPTMDMASAAVTRSRAGGAYAYTDEERKAARGENTNDGE